MYALVCNSLVYFNEVFIYSLQWVAVLRLTKHFCALTWRTDAYCIWISDTGSWKHSGHYHNNQLHSVFSGLWVLAHGRRADLST